MCKIPILKSYIQICRQLRIQAIDQGDVDFAVFHGLPQIIQNDRYIFNLWREQMGGVKPELDHSDKVVYLLSKLALEIRSNCHQRPGLMNTQKTESITTNSSFFI